MVDNDREPNSWIYLGYFIKRRSKAPLRHFSFFAFFIIGIIVAGGLGIWLTLWEYCTSSSNQLNDIVRSIATYFPAIATASLFELICPDENEKYIRSFALFAGVLILILFVFTVNLNPGSISLFVGLLGVAVSLFLWWIANAENDSLRDKAPDNAALGGDVASEAKGDLTGYNT